MKLRLERGASLAGCTIGQLFVDGQEECWTLEDEVREKAGVPIAEWKIKNETAIPRGTYNVIITMSNRFKRDLPLLVEVPGFEGVRIHPGNTSEDTAGCVLVGRNHTDKTVTESKAAFNALYGKIQQALQDGDHVEIEIV